MAFGREPRPYQEGYYLKGMNLKVTKDGLVVKCTRCNKMAEPNKRYKIHSDGAITFHFSCHNCNWTYSIYRNQFAEIKQVEKALLK